MRPVTTSTIKVQGSSLAPQNPRVSPSGQPLLPCLAALARWAGQHLLCVRAEATAELGLSGIRIHDSVPLIWALRFATRRGFAHLVGLLPPKII